MVAFEMVARGLYREDQLVIDYDPTLCMPITDEIQAWMDELWEQKLVRAREQGTLLFDAPIFRFVTASSHSDGTLRIVLSDTRYKHYVTSRIPTFAQGRSRQELGNALAVCSVIETSDGYILLEKRQGVDVYEGRYHVIGGFFERNRDMATQQPDPFGAMRREIREETGIQAADIAEEYCLGAVYDLEMPHGELCFVTRLHISREEVFTREPEDEEVKQLLTLQVTEESLRAFLLEHHGTISVTGEANLLMYGGWKYGEAWFKEALKSIG